MNEKCLHEVADPTIRLSRERPTLIFCPGVAHAHALAKVINNYHDNNTVAAAIDGTTPSDIRAKILRDFHEGKLHFLTNVGVLTEGVDIPPISCIANCRPTKSRTLYQQCIGRSTRLYPGKKNALVLDFTDASQQHQLASTFDILDGNMDLEVKARAEKLSDNDPDLTATDALDQATSQLAEEKRAKLIAQTQFHVVEIDTLDLLGVRLRPGRWGGTESTDGQHYRLKQAGFFHPEEFDKGEASQIIHAVDVRREAGLCTIKMAKVLARAGLNPDVPYKIAHQQIGFLESRRYRLTPQEREFAKQMGGRQAA
jgi:type I site-specific restriction endonuclease